MRGVPFLLLKDLRILKRSPLLVGLLVVYPILIAVLIGLALSKGPDKPRVAILNELPDSGQQVQVAGTSVDPRAYASRLFESIDPVTVHSRAEAVRKVRDGDVLAAIVVPRDLIERLQRTVALSGTGPKPTVEVLYNAEDPVKQQFVESTINSRVADLNRAVSGKLTDITAGYLRILLEGGRFSVFGKDFEIAGLKKSKALVDSVLTRTPQGSPDRDALEQVSRFAGLAIDNLDLSDVVLSSLASPVKVDQTVVSGRRTPLNSYAVTVAVTMSLMLVCVLLAAGMLALEREEHAFARLVRGLVSRTGLLVEKVVLSRRLRGGGDVPDDRGRVVVRVLVVEPRAAVGRGAGRGRARLRRLRRRARRAGARGPGRVAAGDPAVAADRVPRAGPVGRRRVRPLRRDPGDQRAVPVQGVARRGRRRAQRRRRPRHRAGAPRGADPRLGRCWRGSRSPASADVPCYVRRPCSATSLRASASTPSSRPSGRWSSTTRPSSRRR